jgi:hypothetical protein
MGTAWQATAIMAITVFTGIAAIMAPICTSIASIMVMRTFKGMATVDTSTGTP